MQPAEHCDRSTLVLEAADVLLHTYQLSWFCRDYPDNPSIPVSCANIPEFCAGGRQGVKERVRAGLRRYAMREGGQQRGSAAAQYTAYLTQMTENSFYTHRIY